MLDKYEFRGLTDIVDQARRKAGVAITERVAQLDRLIQANIERLEAAEKDVLDLPVAIEKFKAERAELKTVNPSDVIRSVLDDLQNPKEPTP